MPSLKVLRDPVYRLIEPATGWLVRRRVHPNFITTLGFAATLASGVLFHLDHVRTAGLLILVGGLFDIFDGRVARVSGLASKFGSFYDSTLDRISEIVVYIGLFSLYNDFRQDLADVGMNYLILLAMGGSLMVSYTRARAEALGMDCDVGIMQRAERVVLIGLSALLFGLMWNGIVLKAVILVLAVTTNATAIQRILWVHRQAAGVPLDDRVPAAGAHPTAIADGTARVPGNTGPARGDGRRGVGNARVPEGEARKDKISAQEEVIALQAERIEILDKVVEFLNRRVEGLERRLDARNAELWGLDDEGEEWKRS